ncbi:ypt5 protein [Pelagophyceae sp. CCMP2097]|nr:ypt5 protein [Pelagophyceae sp. CCMP2097]
MVLHQHKVVIVGDSGVGKTSLLTRFVKDEFRGAAGTRSTISAAFLERRVELDDGNSVNLEIWDTAGQERFRSLNTPMYYRGAAGAVLVYDACDAESWAHVPGWFSQLKMLGERNVSIALVASKLDLAETKRQVQIADAKAFAEQNKITVFFETSAKTGEHVEDLFRALGAAMVSNAASNPAGAKKGGKIKLEMPQQRRDASANCC